MANIKPLDQSSDKWSRRASVAGEDYLFGVRSPRQAWDTAAAAAEPNYKAAVVAAANAGRFGKGVRKAGNAKWQTGAITKGPTRFSEGVALAKPAWEAGFAPYQRVIETISLPARGPKGSPANLQRVTLVSAALRAAAEKIGG